MTKGHIKEEKISALVDGEIKGQEAEELWEHLHQCSRCQGTLNKFQHLEQTLLVSQREEVSVHLFLDARILAYVKEKSNQTNQTTVSRHWSSGRLAFRFLTAGIFALGILLGVIMGTQMTQVLMREGQEIDISFVLSSEETTPASYFTDLALDFFVEGES